MGALLVYLIPAHMRDLQRCPVVRIDKRIAEKFHSARHDTEALGAAVFRAYVHQCLHPHTDAEEGLVMRYLLDHLIETEALDFLYAITDGSNTRKDDAIRCTDPGGIRGYDHPSATGMFKGLGDRMEVAHAVINNRDAVHGYYGVAGWRLSEICLQAALGGWGCALHSFIVCQGHAQGATECLEDRLGDVMGVDPSYVINV